MRSTFIGAALASLLVLGVVGCQSQNARILDSEESQLELRQIQTRAFDTTDRELMLRTIIATLQDLGFVIDKADDVLGTVTGTKLDQYKLKMTVSIRSRGETQMLVRANAQYNVTPVTDPEPYQQFFSALSKAIFLEANAIE
jgi:hypothetical protein